MSILSRTQVGINIFGNKLIITGYKFEGFVFNELAQLFDKIRGVDPENYKEKLGDLKTFFRSVSKSMGFSLIKPAVFLSLPEEFINCTNYYSFKDGLISAILANGWSKVYFVQEIVAAAIGADLPYNKLTIDGLYTKSIFLFCKSNSVTYGIGCAGGMFESGVIPLNISNINQTVFDKIINLLTRKDIETPKSFVERPYSKEIKERLKSSWEAEVGKTIYIMASDEVRLGFTSKIFGCNFVNPARYESFISLGLDKVRTSVMGN